MVVPYWQLMQLWWLEEEESSYYFTPDAHTDVFLLTPFHWKAKPLIFIRFCCFCSSASRYLFILFRCTVCRTIKRFATSHAILCYVTFFVLSLCVWLWKYETPIRHRRSRSKYRNKMYSVCERGGGGEERENKWTREITKKKVRTDVYYVAMW